MAERSRSLWLITIASIAAAALILAVANHSEIRSWFYAPDVDSPPDVSATETAFAEADAPAQSSSAGASLPAASREPVAPPPPPNDPAPAPRGQADEAFSRGQAALAAGDLIAARAQLSAALASGSLAAEHTAECRRLLTQVAEKVVFGREIIPADPYSRRYVVQPGDALATIVERERLYVPWEGIKRINRIEDERLIRPDQWIKLVQGPFDAIVTKGSFTLDLYHHGMFLKSYRIGLGQNGSTPTGRWIVRPGGRVERAPWTPPAGSGRTGTIEFGQPDYPLGPKGLWIALQGVDPQTEMLVGFGIHGTNEPDSVGRQASLGCIRLGDEDIEELFGLLHGGKSKVEVRP